MRYWKVLLGSVVLLGIAAIPAYACLACISCDENVHVCIGAPSPCICMREGSSCVMYECPDGDTADACCSPFPGFGHAPLRADRTEWRVTYNNGFQLNFGRKNPPKGFDPLKEVATMLTVEKAGKKLIPVTAVKLESWGEMR